MFTLIQFYFAQNIDCGSNEYPQFMFSSKNNNLFIKRISGTFFGCGNDNFHINTINSDFKARQFAVDVFAQNTDCMYTLELPHWCGSNEFPQSMLK